MFKMRLIQTDLSISIQYFRDDAISSSVVFVDIVAGD